MTPVEAQLLHRLSSVLGDLEATFLTAGMISAVSSHRSDIREHVTKARMEVIQAFETLRHYVESRQGGPGP